MAIPITQRAARSGIAEIARIMELARVRAGRDSSGPQLGGYGERNTTMPLSMDKVGPTWEQQQRNRNLKAGHHDRCIVCEKPLTSDIAACSVHVCLCCGTYLAKGERCPTGYDEDGEGGCGYFPVGPDCMKKLPVEYRQ